jgi:threonine-phosphate decarboxylase
MFSDHNYVRETRNLISSERSRLYNLLSSWDTVKVYEPSANFMLMRIKKQGVDADALFDHCIRKGLMIRNCSTFPFLDNTFVRFCFMTHEENNRLIEAFSELLSS